MTKEGKTFFEVFSQSSTGKEGKGTTGGRPGEDLLVVSEISSTSTKKPGRSWRGPYRVGLETIVLGAVGGVLLAVGCFFLGLKVGTNKAVSKGQLNTEKIAYSEKTTLKTPTPVATKVQREKPQHVTTVKNEKPQQVSTAKPPAVTKTSTPVKDSKDVWSLRVVSYKEGSLDRATSIAALLKEQTGQNAFVAKQGSQLVVCLGEFDSKDNTQLVELQKKISALKYDGKVQFAGCYPVRVR